jgi:hypothetical protein
MMASAIIALVVCTALSLSFSSTRGIGVLGTAILIMFFPAVVLAVALLGGAAYLIYQLIHKE